MPACAQGFMSQREILPVLRPAMRRFSSPHRKPVTDVGSAQCAWDWIAPPCERQSLARVIPFRRPRLPVEQLTFEWWQSYRIGLKRAQRVRWTLNVLGTLATDRDGAAWTTHQVVLDRFAQVLGADWMAQAYAPLPRSWVDCPKGICRHFLCPWHLSVETTTRGSLRLVHPAVRVEDRPHSCVWQFIAAHPDGASLEEVGRAFCLTRPRIHGLWVEMATKLRPILGSEFMQVD